MKTKIIFLALMSFSFLALAAEETSPPAKPEHHCKAEVRKYCKEAVKEKGSAVYDCLNENKDKLSPECRKETVAMRKFIHDQREKCRPDAEKFCPDVKHGGGRIHECLQPHLKELSKVCQKTFEHRAQKY